jgi:hypothetical protein
MFDIVPFVKDIADGKANTLRNVVDWGGLCEWHSSCYIPVKLHSDILERYYVFRLYACETLHSDTLERYYVFRLCTCKTLHSDTLERYCVFRLCTCKTLHSDTLERYYVFRLYTCKTKSSSCAFGTKIFLEICSLAAPSSSSCNDSIAAELKFST